MSDILLWLAAAVLLALSGLFSGLNIGLMMARPDDLKRKARQGDKIAARVYRYRKDGYYLIFCILLGNVGVNTALSILLGNMTNGVVGGSKVAPIVMAGSKPILIVIGIGLLAFSYSSANAPMCRPPGMI